MREEWGDREWNAYFEGRRDQAGLDDPRRHFPDHRISEFRISEGPPGTMPADWPLHVDDVDNDEPTLRRWQRFWRLMGGPPPSS